MNKKIVAIGIRRSGEQGFIIRTEEKPLLPGEYSTEAFKKKYPGRYQNLVQCGMPPRGSVKITVMS